MKTLLVVIATVLLLSVQAKHTLHVDNVYPNFGPTTLISGPFTADRIDPEVLNVGVFTINSEDGLTMTTDVDISFRGSRIDATAASIIDVEAVGDDSSLSIVAAATLDISSATGVSFGTDGTLTFNALGSSSVIAQGDVNIAAGIVDLSGDYLQLSSSNGTVFFKGQNLTSSSPALNIDAQSDVIVSASKTAAISARQSVETKSYDTFIEAIDLIVTAERNNILLNGNVGINVDLSEDFIVTAKGGVILASSDGNLNFNVGGDADLFASDDIQLNAVDSIVLKIARDVNLDSSGNTYFLGDHGSHYEFDHGRFIAEYHIKWFSTNHFIETTNGDLIFDVAQGPFNSTAVDFTTMFATQSISYTAHDYIRVIGEQGVDFRAERSSIYFTPAGLNGAPNSNTPFYFDATTDATWRGSDISLTTNDLSIISNYSRFATEDTARASQDIWNLSGDANFDVSSFFFGSSVVTVDVGGDLDFSSKDDFISFSYYQVGSETLLDTSFIFIDNSRNDIEWNTGNTFIWNSDTAVNLFSGSNLEFETDADFRLVGRSTFTAQSADHFSSQTRFDAHYLSPYRGSFHSWLADDNIQFKGGYYHLQVLDSIHFNMQRFIIQSAPFIELTANTEFNINTLQFVTQADRNVVINGEQSWTTTRFIVNGNAFMGSPPNQDLTFHTENDDIHVVDANFYAQSTDIEIQTSTINQFAGNDYTQTTDTEGDLFWETGTISLFGNGQFHIQQHYPQDSLRRQLNIDNQFHFLAQGAMTLGANQNFGQSVFITAEEQFSGYASDIQMLSGPDLTIRAQSVDFEAEQGQLDLSTSTTFTTSSVHFLNFYSQRGNIHIDDAASLQTYSSLGNAFVYAKDSWNLHALTDQDLTISGQTTISFLGGDINSHSTGIASFTSLDDITLYGFDGVIVDSLSTFDLNVESELDITGPTVKFHATDDITVAGNVLHATAAQGDQVTLYTKNTGAYLDIDAAGKLYLWSNDELIANVASFDIRATSSSPNDPQSIFIKSSFQDGGIISYAGGQFKIDTPQGGSFYNAFDDTPTGGDIQFTSSFTTFSSTGPSTSGIILSAAGSEYDESLSRFIGILHRSLNGNILVRSVTSDGVFTADEKLEIFSTDDQVTQTATNTDISVVSTIGGLIAQSANDFSAETQNGDMAWLLSGYSLWKAADTISTLSDCDAQAKSTTGNIHVLADRGEVSFNYRGDQLMHFASATWNTQGADQFTWSVNGDILGDGSLVDIYSDTDTHIFSDASNPANQGIEVRATRNSLYRSSNNNGVAFTTTGGNVDLTATAGWTSQVATGDMVWRGEGDNTFTALTQTVTTLGSISGVFSESVTMTAQSDFVATARNTIGFEAVSQIDIGTQGNSIITVNTGGDTLDNGVYIDAGAFMLNSAVDIDITSNRFISESDGATTVTVGQLLVESQGTDSVGKDLTLSSANTMTFDSQSSITLTGTSARYLYHNALTFSGVSLKIDSSTFIDAEAAQVLSFAETGAWTLNSNALTFTSYGNSNWKADGTAVFSTTGAITAYSDRDTLFGSDAATGLVNFQTNLGNSPITFETQKSTADFSVEATNSITATTTSKISVTANNGITSFSKTTTAFTAADEFSVESTGDVRILAEGLGQSINFVGTDPSGSGSRVDFTSTGNIEGQFVDVGIQARDQYWAPDVDLTFASYLIPDSTGAFSIVATNDLDGSVGGNFNFHTGPATFQAGETITWQAFGVETEQQFGMRFTSLGSSITASAGAGSINFTPDTGLYVTGENDIFSASKFATYNTIGDQTYTVTEDPTDISIASGGALFYDASTISFSATGDEPTSGVISISAAGYNVNTNYPSGTDNFGTAFIASHNLNYDVTDSRFVMDNMQFGTIVPTPDGSVLFEASGMDEYGRAIEILSGNILVTSEVNVVLRAANVNMIELPHDPYKGSTITESGHYLDPLDIDFHLTRHRPTILTVDDQVYTSLGRNINGNGIELTSTVPGADILFSVETLNVNSDASASFLANSLIKMVSAFDTQIVSLRSVNINAHGVSSNPENWVDGINIRTGARDNTFQIGANIAFTPKRDLYMTSFDELTALVVDSLDIVGPGIQFNNIANTGYTLDADTGFYQANEMHISSGDSIHITSENTIYMLAIHDMNIGHENPSAANEHGYHDGRTDIYFDFDQDSGDYNFLNPDVGVRANAVRFYSPLVDMSSTISLIFPIRNTATTCLNTPGQFWLEEVFNGVQVIPSICYCSTNAPLNTPICYRVFYS